MPEFELLRSLSAQESADFVSNLPVQEFGKDSVIFKTDDHSYDVYLILKGQVKSVIYANNGNMSYFKTRKAGDFFGYYSAITHAPRTADMIAASDVTLAKINQQEFVDLVCYHPDIARYFMNVIGDLLRNETVRLHNIITMDSYSRVISDLLTLYQEQGAHIMIPSRDEYASKLNMTRETLSRCLNRLAKEQVVSLRYQTIAIHKPEELSIKVKEYP